MLRQVDNPLPVNHWNCRPNTERSPSRSWRYYRMTLIASPNWPLADERFSLPQLTSRSSSSGGFCAKNLKARNMKMKTKFNPTIETRWIRTPWSVMHHASVSPIAQWPTWVKRISTRYADYELGVANPPPYQLYGFSYYPVYLKKLVFWYVELWLHWYLGYYYFIFFIMLCSFVFQLWVMIICIYIFFFTINIFEGLIIFFIWFVLWCNFWQGTLSCNSCQRPEVGPNVGL